MPIVDFDPNTAVLPDRPAGDAASTPGAVPFTKLLQAHMEMDNVTYNGLEAFTDFLSKTREPNDPGYDQYGDIQGYEGYADQFSDAHNAADVQDIKDKIDRENEVRSLTAASGPEGIAAGMASGIADPAMWFLPGGEAVKAGELGIGFLEGAGRTAIAAGISQTGGEIALHQMQSTRTTSESLGNIATMTLTAGVLGGVAGAMTGSARKAAVKGAEKQLDIWNAYGDAGAMQVDRSTLDSTQIQNTAGLKSLRDPVLKFLDSKGAPDWTKTVASKVLVNADEALAFMNPVDRMSQSPSVVTRTQNAALNETALARVENMKGVARAPAVSNMIGAWDASRAALVESMGDAFQKYRGMSKLASTASDMKAAVTGAAGAPERKMKFSQFGAEILDTVHTGKSHAVPEVNEGATALRKYFDDRFEAAHAVGLVEDDAYKAAKAKGPYAPYLYDRLAIRSNSQKFIDTIHQHLMNKRDAAAARVEEGLKGLDLSNGDVGELFKQVKAEHRSVARDVNAMQKKADASAASRESKLANADTVHAQLNELTGAQERLYRKILDGRDRGESDLSDLFYEFKSTTTRKKELYRQLGAREGEASMHDARFARRQALADQLSKREDDLAKRVDDMQDQLKDLHLDQYKAGFHDGDLRHVAQEIMDRITGLPGGRLSYDNKLDAPGASTTAGKRGSLKARKFDLPYDMARPYLINDLGTVVRSYGHSIESDLELFRRFGALDPEPIKKLIRDDYARLTEGADQKTATRLNKQRDSDVRDLQGTWERIRGTFGNSGGDDYASGWKTAERVAMGVNYMADLGGMTISAFTDLARPVMIHGMTRVYGDGLRALIADPSLYRSAAKEIKEAGVGLDMVLHELSARRFGYDENIPIANRAEAALGAAQHVFTTATLMPVWNSNMMQFAGVISQSRMIKSIMKLAEGHDIGEVETTYLAANYIDKNVAKRIATMYQKYGDKDVSVSVPNARMWDDVKAKDVFRAAIRREVKKAIVTPGQDKPFWISKSGLRLMGQYRSFSFASVQRTMLAGLQQKDMATLNGAAASIGLGIMVHLIKSYQAGIEPKYDLPELITQGFDRSGLSGILMDTNDIMEKVSRNNIGVRPLLGAQPSSRYAARSAAEAVLGPTYGRVLNGLQVTGDMAAGDVRKEDVEMIKRAMPFNKIMGIRTLMDNAADHIESQLPTSKKNH